MGMPILDFANPLHTFSANNLTYTATQDCYLMGSVERVTGGTFPSIKINDTVVAGATDASSIFISPIKLVSGDVVTVATALARMNVYRERTA